MSNKPTSKAKAPVVTNTPTEELLESKVQALGPKARLAVRVRKLDQLLLARISTPSPLDVDNPRDVLAHWRVKMTWGTRIVPPRLVRRPQPKTPEQLLEEVLSETEES